MKKQIQVLEQAFELFNKSKFDSELEMPIITIQTKGRSKCFGWCSTIPFWKNDKDEDMYEINICAEHLNRNFYEIMETLLHEMCHLSNTINDIKDCSASQYHNKKFKEKCEEVGMIVEKTRHGYSETHLSKELKSEIEKWDIDKTVFNLYRMNVNKKKITKEKKKYYKYFCKGCKKEIRSTENELNCWCKDCGCKFEKI